MSPLLLAAIALSAVALLTMGFTLGCWFAHKSTMDALRSMKP